MQKPKELKMTEEVSNIRKPNERKNCQPKGLKMARELPNIRKPNLSQIGRNQKS